MDLLDGSRLHGVVVPAHARVATCQLQACGALLGLLLSALALIEDSAERAGMRPLILVVRLTVRDVLHLELLLLDADWLGQRLL